MKKILSTVFFICFLSFFATAQYSVGVNSYYNINSNIVFKGWGNQLAIGLALSNQISNYFDTQIKMASIFSQENNLLLSSIAQNTYEKTPSSVEMSCMIRLRPIVHENKQRITLSTGLMYRYLYRPSRVTPSGSFAAIAPNLNRAIGIPFNIGAEFDLNKRLTFTLEEENRFFIQPTNKSTGDNGFNFFYYGASLNLVYHLFPKK
jgi:hypothetical protein